MKRCGSCYWFWGSGQRVKEGPMQGQETGECWLNPPQLTMVPSARPTLGAQGPVMLGQMQQMGVSPPTVENRRCKEWTSKTNDTTAALPAARIVG
jgi:hypothetical protein